MFNNNLELSSTTPWNTNKIEYLSDYDEVEATSSVSLDYSTDTPSIGALPSTDEESWIRYDNSVWENKKHTTFSTVYTNNNSSYSTMRTLGYTLDNFLSENVSYKDSNNAGFTLEDFIIKNDISINNIENDTNTDSIYFVKNGSQLSLSNGKILNVLSTNNIINSFDLLTTTSDGDDKHYDF